jgi:hypothetical protein
MRLRVLIHGIWIENTVRLGKTLNEIEGLNSWHLDRDIVRLGKTLNVIQGLN